MRAGSISPVPWVLLCAVALLGTACGPKRPLVRGTIALGEGVKMSQRHLQILERELSHNLSCVRWIDMAGVGEYDQLTALVTKASLEGSAVRIRRVDLQVHVVEPHSGKVLETYHVSARGVGGPVDVVFGGGVTEGFLTDAGEELADDLCAQMARPAR